MDTWIWIIIGILLVLVIIGIIAALTRGSKAKRIERERAEAEQLRAQAAERERQTRESQAAAAATDADARAAEADAQRQAAEADRQAAEAEQRRIEAERLQQEAQAKTEVAEQDRAAHDAKLREADAKDPDVRTDREGNRLADDDGPSRPGGAPVGAGAAVGAGGAAAGAGAAQSGGFRDDDRDGFRDGVVEGEDSYADEPAGADPLLTDDRAGRHAASEGQVDRDLDQPGVGAASTDARTGAATSAGSFPSSGAPEAARGWESSDPSRPDTSPTAEPDGLHTDVDSRSSSHTPSPVEPPADAAPGWESSDPTRPDVAQAPHAPQAPPVARDQEAHRVDHSTPEERPGVTQHGKPGLVDRLRGKVEDIRGDDRPRG